MEEYEDARPENIRVVARIRPLPQAAPDPSAHQCVLSVLHDGKTLQVVGALPEHSSGNKAPKHVSTTFLFDSCIPMSCSQSEVFDRCGIKTLLTAAMSGYGATCFAYGQTGSGKTHTIVGDEQVLEMLDQRSSEGDGMISRSMKFLFSQIEKKKDAVYSVQASFIEIYNEQVRDMLGASTQEQMAVKWDSTQGFHVPKMTMVTCKSKKEIMRVFCRGFRRTRVGSHEMNARSNRSHCLFSVYISSQNDSSFRHGKITFVDLAGSERQKLTGSSSEMLRESGQINKSLFNLGKVISILSENKESAFVPYRDSKLTKLLKDSIGGNCKTLMLTCCSASSAHLYETMRSLEFARRAMNIRNKPVVILDEKETLIRELRKEIRRLKVQNRELQNVVNTHLATIDSTVPALFHGFTPTFETYRGILPGGGTVPLPRISTKQKPDFERGKAALNYFENEEESFLETDDDEEDEDLQRDLISRTKMFIQQHPSSAPNDREQSLMDELQSLVVEYTSASMPSASDDLSGLSNGFLSSFTTSKPSRSQSNGKSGHRGTESTVIVPSIVSSTRARRKVDENGVWAADRTNAEQEMAELEQELARECASATRIEHRRPFSQDSVRAPQKGNSDIREVVSARAGSLGGGGASRPTLGRQSRSEEQVVHRNHATHSRTSHLIEESSSDEEDDRAAWRRPSSQKSEAASRERAKKPVQSAVSVPRQTAVAAAAPAPEAGTHEIMQELDTLKNRVNRAEAAIRLHMDVMSSWQG